MCDLRCGIDDAGYEMLDTGCSKLEEKQILKSKHNARGISETRNKSK